MLPQLPSMCHDMVNHYVKIWLVPLRVANNMHPLSWGIRKKRTLHSTDTPIEKKRNSNYQKSWFQLQCLDNQEEDKVVNTKLILSHAPAVPKPKYHLLNAAHDQKNSPKNSSHVDFTLLPLRQNTVRTHSTSALKILKTNTPLRVVRNQEHCKIATLSLQLQYVFTIIA